MHWTSTGRIAGSEVPDRIANAGHDLKSTAIGRPRARGAFFHHVVLNRPDAELTWDFAQGAAGIFIHDPFQPRPRRRPGSGQPIRDRDSANRSGRDHR